MRNERKKLKLHVMKMNSLKNFRQKAYQLLGNTKNATMNLIHAGATFS
jgi:hypothetical protein